MTVAVPEPSQVTEVPPDPLTGDPPAREAWELAALMRSANVSAEAMDATAGWLSAESRQSQHTQDGYITDLSRWVAWCMARGIDPGAAHPTKADLFAAGMRNAGLVNATRARRLSAVSSWCGYLVHADAATRNPFEHMARPRLPKTSKTKGLSEDQLHRFLAYAQERESARTYALLSLMAATACRVGSVTGALLSGIGEDHGHRVIDMPVKGGELKRFVLPAVTADALAAWLAERGEDPGWLFVTAGGKPLDQAAVFRTVRRVSAAANPKADPLSPHGIRHTVLTILHDRSYPTHIIQDLAGHADSRTTRRYDLARESLDRSPANELGAIFAAGIARHAAAFKREAGS